MLRSLYNSCKVGAPETCTTNGVSLTRNDLLKYDEDRQTSRLICSELLKERGTDRNENRYLY